MAARKLVGSRPDAQRRVRHKLIDLSPITVRGIHARMALIEQKKLELQMLLDGLNKFIESDTGVNLTRQDWTLDLDHAQLKRNTARKQTSGEQHDDLPGGEAA